MTDNNLGSQLMMNLTLSIPTMRKSVDLKFQSKFYKTSDKFAKTQDVDLE